MPARLRHRLLDRRRVVRSVGVDLHRDFCEVAVIEEDGRECHAGRVATEPEALRCLAEDLGVDAQVAFEVVGNAVAIARILEPRVVWVCCSILLTLKQEGAAVDTA